ncbi:glycoside hydrolase superfamily [Tricladium varicosporioides]|nr:glycoside hydrolase superfamily [Hymenoscyphus varicosporioides]
MFSILPIYTTTTQASEGLTKTWTPIATGSLSTVPIYTPLSVSSSSAAATLNTSFPTLTGSSTATASSTVGLSVDDLWDLFVGPVSTAAVSTTVSATPIPTAELIPPPGIYYSSFPTGQQIPMMSKNSSWKFPAGFWWGVASASYQVEGAVKDEGRGPSIWDVLLHRVVGYSVANQTGDIANNQYYLYKQDIARIAALGVKTYSFSISWSRIFPYGSGYVNEKALAHYEDVIDTCIEYGVEPSVTLYHWDLPLWLQNTYGGWLDERIVGDFLRYAQVVFTRYGNKVPRWFTVNEPIVFCNNYPLPDNYFKNTSIPKKQQPYWCGHHVLLAHSQAYHLGKSLGLNGTISFKTNGGYKIPLTNSSADATAVQRAWDFNEGWFANPTFTNGDYPTYLKDYVRGFLPEFTQEQKNAINGSSDVYAHDAYTSQFYFAPDSGINACVQNLSHPLYPVCANTTYTYAVSSGGWNIGPAADPLSPWLHKATDWVPAFLRYIQDTWKPVGGIAITEFGFAEPFEALKTIKADITTDAIRTSYYRDYMQAILMAISEGVNVVGCLAWSIVDNLEWSAGYQARFGIQYVNFTTQERTYKSSFFEYVNAFKLYGTDPVVPHYVTT